MTKKGVFQKLFNQKVSLPSRTLEKQEKKKVIWIIFSMSPSTWVFGPPSPSLFICLFVCFIVLFIPWGSRSCGGYYELRKSKYASFSFSKAGVEKVPFIWVCTWNPRGGIYLPSSPSPFHICIYFLNQWKCWFPEVLVYTLICFILQYINNKFWNILPMTTDL